MNTRTITRSLGPLMAILLFCLSPVRTWSQLSPERDPYTALQKALELYHSGLFRAAYEAYDAIAEESSNTGDPLLDAIHVEASLGRAKSALLSGHPHGEVMLQEVIVASRPDPAAVEASMFLADHYYNSGNYEKAITYYETIRSAGVDQKTLSEARFKQGYSHFVRKEFDEAQLAFGEVKELRTEYYYPTNYYYGMCLFFREDYAAALTSFERVAQSDRYKDHVPYYIAQIHFAQGNYDKVLAYAEPKLQGNPKNKSEIAQLVGRSYFEKGDYARARVFLQEYAQSGGQMRAEDFYQLAFVQYEAGDCAAAIPNFKQVSFDKSALGQRANYYLGSCFLRGSDLQGAYNAFSSAARMDYDQDVKMDATLQTGKVAAQLHYDADAIRLLDGIPSGSQYYASAQETLKNIFQSSGDFASTLKTLENLPQLSPTLKAAYQEVSLYRGIQLIQDNRLDAAQTALEQVDKYPINQAFSAQALFWRGEIAHRQGAYDKSADLIRQYFVVAKTVKGLPPESSEALAYYLQGYNYLHAQNYIQAQSHFADAAKLLKQNRTQYEQSSLRTVLPDALVRAGDCAFKRNQYADAKRYYDDAAQLGGPQMVYARYQRAIIAGLERNVQEKVRILEELQTDYPGDDLADDVLLQLGVTYHETQRPEQAIAVLEKFLAKYPSSELYVQALLRLGLITYNSGASERALQYYKRVFSHNPSAEEGREALTAIEEIYVQDLKTPDAYFAFVASVPGYEIGALKKDSLSFRVAEIQYEKGEYQGAVKSFTEYLTKYPGGVNVVPAYFYRGDSYAIQKDFSHALQDFETVAKKGPGRFYADALNRAALLSYNDAQDFAKAFQYYKLRYESMSEPTQKFDAALGAVRSAYRAGNYADVGEWYPRVADHPQAPDAVRAEAWYYGARAAMDQKSYPVALQLFKKVSTYAENAQAAESRFRIAQILFLDNQLDAAEEQCNTANSANGNYPFWVAKSLILLSDIYVKRMDYFNARAPLEAVIENFQGDQTIVQEAQKKLDALVLLEEQNSKVHRDTSGMLEMIKEEE